MEAAKYEMQVAVAFQSKLTANFQNSIQVESGLQIGPLQSIQVEMDAAYHAHLRAMQQDAELA